MSFCIQSSLFGSSKAGRFGNQFFQLLFFYIISERLDCTLRLPKWSGQSIFENHHFLEPLPVGNIYNLEMIYNRADGPESLINLLNPLIKQSPDNLDITGSFQFHTNTLYKYRNLLDNKFIYTKICDSIKFQLNEISKNSELICIHWREGDYNEFNNQHPYFWKPTTSSLLFEIKKLINISGESAKVYLASDDSEKIVEILKNEGINVLTSDHFTSNPNEFFLWDFIALVVSDIFVASNSSMSIAASMLNKNAKIFSRSNSPNGEFYSFLPWRTEVLINQFN